MEPGQVIDEQYRLIRPIGEGGFGAVWLAEETALGRRVALKFLKRELDREELVRFKREVQALGRLAHDHILTLYSVGEHRGSRYIVTEFVSGQTLDDWKPRSMDDIVAVGTQIAAALVAAHREGVVHRDLKPPNVMVLPAANGAPLVKVLDFGIAKLAGPKQLDITATGDIVGTPGFMSPEQLRGVSDIGPASDLYNLGVILWELIEQRRIFEGDSALEISMQHLVDPAPPLTTEGYPQLARLIAQLLEKEPHRRGSAAAAVRALRPRTGPERVAPAAAPRAEPRWMRNLLLVIALMVLISLALVAILRPEPGPVDPPPTAIHESLTTVDEKTPFPEDSSPASPSPQDEMMEPGCIHAWEPGTIRAWEAQNVLGAPIAESVSYSIINVPPGYSPTRRNPLVVFLHAGGMRPEDMQREAAGLVRPGLADGALFLFVEGLRKKLSDKDRESRPTRAYAWSRDQSWSTENHDQQVEPLVAAIKTMFCVDEKRVFLVGDGRGARGAERIVSQSDTFAAVATTDYRRKGRDHDGESPGEPFLLGGRPAIPYLWINSKESKQRPLDGKTLKECKMKHDLVPYREQEAVLLEHHQCSTKTSDGTCTTWDCEVPLVTCLTKGGRHWPDYSGKTDECNKISKFDVGAKIWDFFKTTVAESVAAQPDAE